MTTLGKILFVTLGLAVLIAGTLLLRSGPEPALGQLTPAQMAELKPAAKPPEPPKAVQPPEADAGVPQDPDLEDGSGS